MIKLIFRITPGLHKKLKDYATENGIAVSAALRTIISQFFKARQ
jgi:hypothetical protein